MLLPLPIPGVRLATTDDLLRISLVAAASFFWSPTFRFQRPLYHDFPSDTVASYLAEYTAALQDPACVVLVAEDTIQEDEALCVYEALRSIYEPASFRSRGIVGVCSLSLKPNSPYLGHFHSAKERLPASGENVNASTLSPQQHALYNRKRDQSSIAISIYNDLTQPAKLKYARILCTKSLTNSDLLGTSLGRCA